MKGLSLIQHLQQLHRDAVVEPPPGVDVLGSSSGCDIQVLYQPKRVFTVQGHPEFDRSITEELLDMRQDILGRELYENGISRIGLDQDSDLFPDIMWKFVQGLDITN
jgi:GMP synthase-like glutamine amidotransferase